MRVFNTGAGDFWRSRIGERLRWLKLTNSQYHRAKGPVVALVEKIARAMLLQCRRFNQWPTVAVRRDAVFFEWRGRGEMSITLSGTKMVYAPDPIRKSKTFAMTLDLTIASPAAIDKFLKGFLWHLLEARP